MSHDTRAVTSSDRPKIDVVAGIIFNDDASEVLLSYRSAAQHQGERWEFPGGKMEAGETVPMALTRELQEELGITVSDVEPFQRIEHQYPDKHVVLHFCKVTGFSGVPSGKEQQQIAWVPIQQLGDYRFPDANQVIVDALLAEVTCANSSSAS